MHRSNESETLCFITDDAIQIGKNSHIIFPSFILREVQYTANITPAEAKNQD